MRLSFYSGLALSMIAADTAKAVELDDDFDAHQLAQLSSKEIAAADNDAEDWQLAQGLSEGNNMSTIGTESEADADSEAFVTTESEVESSADADSGSDVGSEGDSDAELDSDSDAEAESEGDSDAEGDSDGEMMDA